MVGTLALPPNDRGRWCPRPGANQVYLALAKDCKSADRGHRAVTCRMQSERCQDAEGAASSSLFRRAIFDADFRLGPYLTRSQTFLRSYIRTEHDVSGYLVKLSPSKVLSFQRLKKWHKSRSSLIEAFVDPVCCSSALHFYL